MLYTPSKTQAVRKNPWLVRRAGANPALRLFCFSYAGGNASIYDAWQAELDERIEVCAVQLPGRGTRFHEAPCTSLSEILNPMADILLAERDLPYAFFGHSLGALVAFELARLCQRRYMAMPVHLFVSGCAAPQCRDPSEDRHKLPDDELLASLNEYNGTPPEILSHAELMKLVLPTVRADFSLAETYQYKPAEPLNLPITVFSGRLDPHVRAEQAQGWQKETRSPIAVRWCEGDHFFINGERNLVLDCLNSELVGLQCA